VNKLGLIPKSMTLHTLNEDEVTVKFGMIFDTIFIRIAIIFKSVCNKVPEVTNFINLNYK